MKVLFATPECAPLVKTGGLGDVSAALPAALFSQGVDVRLLLPGYPSVLAHVVDAPEVARFELFSSGHELSLLEGKLGGLPLYVLHCPSLFDRPGTPYLDPEGRDWSDNALRFAALSRAAAVLGAKASPLAWRPDVVHGNDWPCGLSAAYLHFEREPRARSVMTIHNLAFQGNFDASMVTEFELPAASFSVEGVEFHGRLSFMKAGLYYADAITAVSEGYAREIQSLELGCGLHGLLSARREALHGITNGIDVGIWDPANDALIPSRYSAKSLYRKKRDKQALQERMGLEVDAEIPVLGLVSRLTHQKGTDLVVEAAGQLLALPAQIAVLGSGDAAQERALQGLAAAHPGRCAVQIGFDEPLAHLIEAGADLFLMPSRFEPCGMNQMYSQRYGTPPVVHATGGLAETVVDTTARTLMDGTASGFVFAPASAEALADTVRRATELYRRDRRSWQALQKAAMGKDFSWTKAAGRYVELYTSIMKNA